MPSRNNTRLLGYFPLGLGYGPTRLMLISHDSCFMATSKTGIKQIFA